jgi:hypothetical protein
MAVRADAEVPGLARADQEVQIPDSPPPLWKGIDRDSG